MPLHLKGVVGGQAVCWPLEGTRRVGRGHEADLQITDPTVSKLHAEIVTEARCCTLRDLGSRNGTRVNGRSLAGACALEAGDRVDFGQVSLTLLDLDDALGALGDLPPLATSMAIPAHSIIARPARLESRGPELVPLLAEIGRLLVVPRPLRETCDEILAIVERAVPCTRTVVMLGDDPGSRPRPIATRERGAPTHAPLVLSQEIVRQVVEDRAAVLVRDAARDPEWRAHASLVAGAVHSAIAVPLVDGERVLGLLYVDSHDPLGEFGERELEVLTLVANMAAVKIANARLLAAEAMRARVEQELQLARQIQRSLLPPDAPVLPGWSSHLHLRTCHEVGGDLLDWWIDAGGALQVLIGDVAGKGIGAALLMSSVVTSARMLRDDAPPPERLAERLDATIHRSTDAGLFVTAIVARLDPVTGSLTYVNAGHPPPLLIADDGERELSGSGLPLGVTGQARYEPVTVTLPPGSVLALYTDGVTEARRDAAFFGVEGVCTALRGAGPKAGAAPRGDALVEALAHHLAGEPPADDLTLFLLERR